MKILIKDGNWWRNFVIWYVDVGFLSIKVFPKLGKDKNILLLKKYLNGQHYLSRNLVVQISNHNFDIKLR